MNASASRPTTIFTTAVPLMSIVSRAARACRQRAIRWSPSPGVLRSPRRRAQRGSWSSSPGGWRGAPVAPDAAACALRLLTAADFVPAPGAGETRPPRPGASVACGRCDENVSSPPARCRIARHIRRSRSRPREAGAQPSATDETRDGRMARSGGRGSASWFLMQRFALALAGATGCGSLRLRRRCRRGRAASSTSAVQPAGDASTDKLAQVLARGTLILFTDPKYPPQSFAVKGAKRPATRSAPRTR